MAELCAIIHSSFGGLYFGKYGPARIFFKSAFNALSGKKKDENKNRNLLVKKCVPICVIQGYLGELHERLRLIEIKYCCRIYFLRCRFR